MSNKIEPLSLCFLILSLFGRIRADLIPPILAPIVGDLVCKVANCGNGTCRPANNIFMFDCDCNHGWKKMELFNITLPPCILPNCTLNFDCGGAAPPLPSPPPPPPPSLLPPLPITPNSSDPCSYTRCGDGVCVPTNGSGYRCDCNPGSFNLLNMTNLACFKECYFGADCAGLGFGPQANPPPPTNGGTKSKPGDNGSPPAKNQAESMTIHNFSWDLRVLSMLLFASIFFNGVR